jgi:hypothetical protein
MGTFRDEPNEEPDSRPSSTTSIEEQPPVTTHRQRWSITWGGSRWRRLGLPKWNNPNQKKKTPRRVCLKWFWVAFVTLAILGVIAGM